MELIYQRNISFLSKHFPFLCGRILPVESITSCSYRSEPEPNIFYGGRPFHSPTDPLREAQNLVKDLRVRKGTIIIFFGIGLGYHIEEFKRRYTGEAEQATLLVVERSLEAFSLLVHHRDISFLAGMRLFIGESSDIVQKFIDTLGPLSFTGYRIIELRGNVDAFDSYYGKIAGYFRRIMTGKLSDLLTRLAFENLWIRNIIDNLCFLAGRRSVRALRHTLLGKPAMVINAGPSLLHQLDTLKELSPWMHLIAVDTVLEPLLRYGIEPDFVITLDAGFFNFYDFHYLFTGTKNRITSCLVADMVAYPQILRNWKGELFFSETASTLNKNGAALVERHPLLKEFGTFFTSADYLDCGGSVSTTAVEFALHTGAHPVFVTGLDLAYSQFATHVNSSSHYNEYYKNANRLGPLPTLMAREISGRKLLKVPGLREKKVLSDFVFDNYRQWFGAREKYRDRVFNVSDGGVRIPGIPHLRLKALTGLKPIIQRKVPIQPADAYYLERDVSVSFLRSLRNKVRRMRSDVEKRVYPKTLVKNYEFLKNSILEASALYPDPSSFNSYLVSLLGFIEKRIDRSIGKLLEANGIKS